MPHQKVQEKYKLIARHEKNLAYFFHQQKIMVTRAMNKRELAARELESPPLTHLLWEGIWAEIAMATTPELIKIIASAESDGLHAGATFTGSLPRSSFNLANPRAVAWFQRNGGSVDYIKGIQETTSKRVKAVISDGLDTGKSYNEVTRLIRAEFDNMSRKRAQAIATYETGNAYEAGNRMFADSLVEDGITIEKMWNCEAESCEVCVANQEEGWIPIEQQHQSGHDQPEAHLHCVAAGTLCISPGGFIAGIRGLCHSKLWTLTTASGRILTVTPNHMFLTKSGFVPANSLCKGDYVLNCPDFERIVPDCPDGNESISSVDDVFRALSVSPGMLTHSMPTTPEDLHGDGGIVDGNVDIVFPDSLLLSTGKPAFHKPFGANTLNTGSSGECDLLSEGTLTELFKRLFTTANGSMGGGGMLLPLIRGKLRIPEVKALTSPARNDIKFQEPAINNPSGNLKNLRETLDGVTGIIQSDEIVRIDVAGYHGYIYDFQTISGLCIYNGLVTSNCVCFETYREVTEGRV